MKPHEIEKLSFEIIDREAGDHGFNQEMWPIVRRMIHTSADFDAVFRGLNLCFQRRNWENWCCVTTC